MHTAKVGNLVENLAEQDDLRTGLGTQVRLGDDSEQSFSDSNFPGAAFGEPRLQKGDVLGLEPCLKRLLTGAEYGVQTRFCVLLRQPSR